MKNEINKDMIKQQELSMLIELDEIARENNLAYYLGYGTALGAVRHRGFIPWDTDIDIIVDIDSYKRFCEVIDEKINTLYELKSIDTDSKYDSLKARVSLKGYSHNVIHIDIFPMVGSPKSNIGKKMFSKISYLNYRCYFIKKVNTKLNYKDNLKKRTLTLFAKLVLLPIPSSTFKLIFKKLSTRFPITKSDVLYNICGSYGMKEYVPKKWLGQPEYMYFESQMFPVPQEWDKYLTHIYGDYITPKRTNYV